MTTNWHSVGKLAELKSKISKYAEVAGKEIAVFCLKGELFAVDNFCPHRGGPLFRGNIEPGPSVRCPLHGWHFDLNSGNCLNMPQAKVSTFPVEIRGEEVFVKIK